MTCESIIFWVFFLVESLFSFLADPIYRLLENWSSILKMWELTEGISWRCFNSLFHSVNVQAGLMKHYGGSLNENSMEVILIQLKLFLCWMFINHFFLSSLSSSVVYLSQCVLDGQPCYCWISTTSSDLWTGVSTSKYK